MPDANTAHNAILEDRTYGGEFPLFNAPIFYYLPL